jgi:hypothetical protein
VNEAIKTKWIEALTSGEYERGEGYLHHIDADGDATFCCLGVLCDLAVKAGVEMGVDVYDRSDGSKSVLYQDEESFLPFDVAQWADINPRGEFFIELSEGWMSPQSLPDLNDNGASFQALAAYIKDYL